MINFFPKVYYVYDILKANNCTSKYHHKQPVATRIFIFSVYVQHMTMIFDLKSNIVLNLHYIFHLYMFHLQNNKQNSSYHPETILVTATLNIELLTQTNHYPFFPSLYLRLVYVIFPIKQGQLIKCVLLCSYKGPMGQKELYSSLCVCPSRSLSKLL